jgi:hypothetical protein
MSGFADLWLPRMPRAETVSNLIADNRRRAGESYVAGGAALNELIGGRRVSDHLDIFHDTAEAVHREFDQDAAVLLDAGLTVNIRRRALEAAVAAGQVRFHYGSLRGAYPAIVS